MHYQTKFTFCTIPVEFQCFGQIAQQENAASGMSALLCGKREVYCSKYHFKYNFVKEQTRAQCRRKSSCAYLSRLIAVIRPLYVSSLNFLMILALTMC